MLRRALDLELADLLRAVQVERRRAGSTRRSATAVGSTSLGAPRSCRCPADSGQHRARPAATPGCLLTGDTVAEVDGQALLGPFTVDREHARQSLRRQAGLAVEVACVGHGNPITGDVSAALRTTVDAFAA